MLKGIINVLLLYHAGHEVHAVCSVYYSFSNNDCLAARSIVTGQAVSSANDIYTLSHTIIIHSVHDVHFFMIYAPQMILTLFMSCFVCF